MEATCWSHCTPVSSGVLHICTRKRSRLGKNVDSRKRERVVESMRLQIRYLSEGTVVRAGLARSIRPSSNWIFADWIHNSVNIGRAANRSRRSVNDIPILADAWEA